MRTTLVALVAGLALCLTVGNVRAAEHRSESARPDATLSISGTSVAAGVGASWGSGTLMFRGKEYPVSVSGLTIASVGASKGNITGKVFHLNRLSDFDGTYAAVGADATVGGGKGVSTMKNQHGVRVDLFSTTQGLEFTLGTSGIAMNIEHKASSTAHR